MTTAESVRPHDTRVRYNSLDAWRGVAALWVVMVHAALLPLVIQNSPRLQRVPLYAFSTMGSLGVQCFFVISGFCIANAAAGAVGNSRGCWRFLKARVRRIYPPYFAASVVAVALALIATWLVKHGYVAHSAMADAKVFDRSWLYVVSSLTLTQVPLRQAPIIIVFWTLCYEAAFYLIVLISMAFAGCRRPSVRRLLDVLHALTFLSLVLLIWRPNYVVFPFDLWPQFGFGILVYDLLSHSRHRGVWMAASVSAVLGITLAVLYNHGSDLGKVGTRGQYITAVLFAAALVGLHRVDRQLANRFPVRALGSVGLFSYSLYLTHPLAQGLALQLFRRFHIIDEQSFSYVFWLQILCSIPCAIVFFWLFERPFIGTSRRPKTPATIDELEPTAANPVLPTHMTSIA